MLNRTLIPTTPTRRSNKTRVCMHGASCVKYGCPYAHPDARPKDCPDGDQCQRRDVCKLHHPRSNKEITCPFGLRCQKPHCPFAHGVAKTTLFCKPCKPCMHGAFCVKFGCGYAHPPGRREECEFGVLCTNTSCTKLHPRPSKKSAPSQRERVPKSSWSPKFYVGQQVEAQYRVGANWRLANVLQMNACSFTLHFLGFDDSVDIPVDRIRHRRVSEALTKSDIPPGFGSFISRGAAVAATGSPSLPSASVRKSPNSVFLRKRPISPSKRSISPSKRTTSQSDNLRHLEGLKRAAIMREDFLLANELKQRIKKVGDLELEKTAAVREEDFLRAMNIKTQIDELTNAPTSSAIKQEVETKQQDRVLSGALNTFSFFTKTVKPIRVC